MVYICPLNWSVGVFWTGRGSWLDRVVCSGLVILLQFQLFYYSLSHYLFDDFVIV
jgi:hypothetical protein